MLAGADVRSRKAAMKYEGTRGPGCEKCQGDGWQIHLHNYFGDYRQMLKVGAPRGKQDADKFPHKLIARESLGPCFYCSGFNWILLTPDNRSVFVDNETEARELEEKGYILLRTPTSVPPLEA